MVATPEQQAPFQLQLLTPNVRKLGSLYITGKVTHRPVAGYESVALINGATIYELARPLIPHEFEGKVCLYVDIIEIIEPPKEKPSPE